MNYLRVLSQIRISIKAKIALLVLTALCMLATFKVEAVNFATVLATQGPLQETLKLLDGITTPLKSVVMVIAFFIALFTLGFMKDFAVIGKILVVAVFASVGFTMLMSLAGAVI